MKNIWFAFLLLIPMVSPATATDISVGGVSLTIPDPEGFSPVTQEMELLFELQKQFVAPTNEEFVSFIPEQDVPAVLQGNIPNLPRRFTVQTVKTLIDKSVSTSGFEEFKSIIKTQNDKIMQEAEALLPGLTQQMNEGINEKYDIDIAFSVSQMMPMPIHHETDNTLAYSALVKYEMNDENGNPASDITVVTTTLVHVKNKVMFLYTYAEESGLEWSKAISKKWVTAIVAENPTDPRAPLQEEWPPADSGMDWESVGKNALVGAIIGLVVGLIGWAIRRRKRKTS